nr:hypothetical protein GCM10025732_15630 [Glycomyces mayteni]
MRLPRPLEAAADIEALGVPELEGLAATLRDKKAGLRKAVPDLLGLARDECRSIIDAAAKAASELATDDGADLVSLARSYPDDPGVLVSLLLNHITLQPGEAVYMPAGNLHAYLHGFGVEIMAASDNVLRGGLTNKRVDVPELLRVLDFQAMADPRTAPEDDGPVRTWPVPIDDFLLRRVELTGEPLTVDVDGPASASPPAARSPSPTTRAPPRWPRPRRVLRGHRRTGRRERRGRAVHRQRLGHGRQNGPTAERSGRFPLQRGNLRAT